MALIQLEPPAPFNFQTPDVWPQWKKKCFEQYRIASELTTSTKEKQVGPLLDCIGEATESVLSFTNATEELKKYDTVIEKFYIFFKVCKTERHIRTCKIQPPQPTMGRNHRAIYYRALPFCGKL